MTLKKKKAQQFFVNLNLVTMNDHSSILDKGTGAS